MGQRGVRITDNAVWGSKAYKSPMTSLWGSEAYESQMTLLMYVPNVSALARACCRVWSTRKRGMSLTQHLCSVTALFKGRIASLPHGGRSIWECSLFLWMWKGLGHASDIKFVEMTILTCVNFMHLFKGLANFSRSVGTSILRALVSFR